MKKISVLIPCYNEEENVVPISEAVIGIITKELPQYDYELVFIDNDERTAQDALCKEPEDQGDLQCEKLWTVQLPILWNPSGNR